MENNVVDIAFSQELGEKQIRRVYLITYSQAIMKKMANCQAFADCILEAFSQSQGNQKDNATHPELACVCKASPTEKWNQFIFLCFSLLSAS